MNKGRHQQQQHQSADLLSHNNNHYHRHSNNNNNNNNKKPLSADCVSQPVNVNACALQNHSGCCSSKPLPCRPVSEIIPLDRASALCRAPPPNGPCSPMSESGRFNDLAALRKTDPIIDLCAPDSASCGDGVGTGCSGDSGNFPPTTDSMERTGDEGECGGDDDCCGSSPAGPVPAATPCQAAPINANLERKLSNSGVEFEPRLAGRRQLQTDSLTASTGPRNGVGTARVGVGNILPDKRMSDYDIDIVSTWCLFLNPLKNSSPFLPFS